VSERCCELSEQAGETLAGTAVTAETWLVVEVPGPWPRDVSMEGTLPAAAQAAVTSWLAETPRSRLQFVRRRARSSPGLRVFVVTAEETRRGIRALVLDRHDDLSGLDLDAAGETFAGPLVLVCGHGSRDQCCALRATGVFAELDGALGEDELWISSHQGGHRFAANVLVLPAALQFGRVEPAEASRLVADALGGLIDLDRYRGRTCYESPVMAAEHAVRRAAGIVALDDLRLDESKDGLVSFRGTDGTAWRAVVEETSGPAVPASCGAEAEPQRSFSVRVL
jgi:hypothetical protein